MQGDRVKFINYINVNNDKQEKNKQKLAVAQQALSGHGKLGQARRAQLEIDRSWIQSLSLTSPWASSGISNDCTTSKASAQRRCTA